MLSHRTTMGRARPARWLSAALAVVLAACSPSGGGGADPTVTQVGSDAPSATVPADLAGQVDEIVAMLPPAPGDRRPDDFALGGGTVLASRPVLRAPGAPGEPLIDLWILQVRMDAQAGGGLQECRAIVEVEGGMSASCSRLGPMPGGAAGGPPPLIQLSTSGPRSLTVALSGPDDTTHFIVTAGGHRIAVIPIEGEAVLRLVDGCPPDATVAAWRGDELLREEPGLMC